MNDNLSKSSNEMARNGYVTAHHQTHQTPRTEMEGVPHDILCGPDESTGESHASKKHKKSKKHKLKNNDEDRYSEEVESNGIHIEPNAVATDDILVLDSSNDFSIPKGKPLVPKIIISRNADDFNRYMVKENAVTSQKQEKNLKRRRSMEDSSMHDGKRSRSDRDTDEESSVSGRSIPNFERRLSVRLEDAFGEYTVHIYELHSLLTWNQ